MSHQKATRTLLPGSSRRHFLQGLAATTSLLALSAPGIAAKAKPALVVIGGGAGGATFVRALQALASDVFDITVVSDQKFYNAPFALNSYNQKEAGFCTTTPVDLVSAFKRQGVRTIIGRVETLDPDKKTLHLTGSDTPAISYDILIAAPGIAMNWDAFGLKGTLDIAAIWTSGASCQNLPVLLKSVPVGGTFALVAPAGPHRCPPAVYERACLCAHWFKTRNKTAKILIIDEKEQYPMQALFEEAYADYYEDMIEWIPREFHGGITRVDLSNKTIQTDADLFEPDQLNVIPPQKSPDFLNTAGLTGADGYCTIIVPSMQSVFSKDIYIIGDAASAGEISKSAISAGVEARLAAADIMNRFSANPRHNAIDISDNCWTILAPEDAISLGGTYSSSGNRFTSNERFMSTVEDDADKRTANAKKAANTPGQILQSLYGG